VDTQTTAPQGQGTVAPQAGPPAPAVTTPPVAAAAPAAPAQPAQGASPAEADFWKQKAAALEQDVRKLKSSYDTRLTSTQQELQRIKAQQQAVEQQQVAQLPDEDKLRYEHAKMQQELAAAQQALAEKTAQEAALANYMQTRSRYAGYGVPYEVLDQHSESPQSMEEAAFNYLRSRTGQSAQPAPVQQFTQPQQQQQWSPPVAPQQQQSQAATVHPTSHTAPAPRSVETDLQDLAEITRTQKTDTVYEALKRLDQEVTQR
jgi:hypothetical protein